LPRAALIRAPGASDLEVAAKLVCTFLRIKPDEERLRFGSAASRTAQG